MIEPESPAVTAPAPTIELAHVSRWHGSVVAVNDVSLAIGPGITGLLGLNGAGKTTLLCLIAGLLAPSQGRIRVLGRPVRANPTAYRQLALVLDHDASYPYLSAREFVRFNARLYGIQDEAAVERALVAVDLLPVANRSLGSFSKGMRQRARLAAGLVHDPAVILLDEPFSGADPRQRQHLMELLRAQAAAGKTIIVSSHILDEVEQLAQEVLVMISGRLGAAGSVGALRRAILDWPHRIRVRSDRPRLLAATLLPEPVVTGVELSDDGALIVAARELGECARAIPRVAREGGIHLREVVPLDESLDRIFARLVAQ